MNSVSKKYVDPCLKARDDDPETSREVRRESEVILKAATIINPTTIPAGTTVGTSYNLASVTLDTSQLLNPLIKLDFASNLAVTAATFTGAIAFQIVKKCDSQFQQNNGRIWTFLENGFTVTNSTTFSFFEFDGGNCCGECCTYTVVATVVTIPGSTATVTTGTLAINPISFGLLAVENTHKNKCCC